MVVSGEDDGKEIYKICSAIISDIRIKITIAMFLLVESDIQLILYKQWSSYHIHTWVAELPIFSDWVLTILGDGCISEDSSTFFWLSLSGLDLFKFCLDIGIRGFRRFFLWTWVGSSDSKLFFEHIKDKNPRGLLPGLEIQT